MDAARTSRAHVRCNDSLAVMGVRSGTSCISCHSRMGTDHYAPPFLFRLELCWSLRLVGRHPEADLLATPMAHAVAPPSPY
ncbi:MAG: hypothetical protein QY310_11470 [Candidatus Jettenia sp. CY-1]|nr:hypothetical protein [Candidatus Jettenia sp.]WKZ18048.1 MAG: hypothetical protein QY310_11470 [Candidatus Jettenia sp. CY-1]